MLLCGTCGRRLGIRYTGNGGIYPVYQCIWKHREALSPRACLSITAAPLDQAITSRLVNAITPATIELALAALTSLEERDCEIGSQWRMRIERARYDMLGRATYQLLTRVIHRLVEGALRRTCCHWLQERSDFLDHAHHRFLVVR